MVEKCTCIIPFYNEGKRINSVLSSLSKIPQINQIVCIDDGSSDGSSALIKKQFPGVELIKLPKNVGKSDSVSIGLKESKHNLILLFDADLTNIKQAEISNGIDAFQRNALDLIIFRVKGGNNIFDKLLRKEILFSGIRLIRKSELTSVLKQKPRRFQLEVLTNKYMMKKSKKAAWIKCSALNIHKARKYGLIKGLGGSIKMELEIITYLGIIEFLKQINHFCKEELVFE